MVANGFYQPYNQKVLNELLKRYGIKINNEVTEAPSLIIVNGRSLLFSEPNRLLLDGCPKNITKLMNNFQIHNIFAHLIV